MTTDQPATPGVVIHLNSADTDVQEGALRSAANLLAQSQPARPVEIVVHGAAIGICLAGHPKEAAVADILALGTVVAACEIALNRQGIQRERLAPGVTTVPSAIVELVARQHQGWAYLRP